VTVPPFDIMTQGIIKNAKANHGLREDSVIHIIYNIRLLSKIYLKSL
jgi:hypothetical protein